MLQKDSDQLLWTRVYERTDGITAGRILIAGALLDVLGCIFGSEAKFDFERHLDMSDVLSGSAKFQYSVSLNYLLRIFVAT